MRISELAVIEREHKAVAGHAVIKEAADDPRNVNGAADEVVRQPLSKLPQSYLEPVADGLAHLLGSGVELEHAGLPAGVRKRIAKALELYDAPPLDARGDARPVPKSERPRYRR